MLPFDAQRSAEHSVIYSHRDLQGVLADNYIIVVKTSRKGARILCVNGVVCNKEAWVPVNVAIISIKVSVPVLGKQPIFIHIATITVLGLTDGFCRE